MNNGMGLSVVLLCLEIVILKKFKNKIVAINLQKMLLSDQIAILRHKTGVEAVDILEQTEVYNGADAAENESRLSGGLVEFEYYFNS